MAPLSSRFLKDEITLYGIAADLGSGSGTTPLTDRYGNELMVEINLGTYPAEVSAGASSEEEYERDTFTIFYDFTVQADCPVEGVSSIEWNGEQWEVVGEPSLHFDRRELHHKEFQARRFEG